MAVSVVSQVALALSLVSVCVALPAHNNHDATTFSPVHWAQADDVDVDSATGYDPDNSGASIEFVCAYRTYAYEYGQQLKPNYDKAILFDSLMLGTLCNQTRPSESGSRFNAGRSVQVQGMAVYVSTSGSDSNPGTQSSPKATIAGGLTATRKMPMGPKTLVIEEGTYYLSEKIVLTTEDSHLSIQGTGEVWISGAKQLPKSLTWIQHKVRPAMPASLNVLNGTDTQSGCTASASQSNCVCYNSSTPQGLDAGKCAAVCKALGPEQCTSFGWSGARGASDAESSGGDWANQCCIRNDGVWNPKPMANHVSGKFSPAIPGFTSYSTKLGPEWVGSNISQLRIKDTTTRQLRRSPRARYPNGNPETDQWPVGWNIGAAQWLPPKQVGQPLFVNVNNSELNERNSTSFNFYGGGIGGPCGAFSPPFSYWCQAHPSGGGGFQYFVPSGLGYSTGDLPNTTTTTYDTKKWTLQLWRRAHWANWMFDVDSIDTTQQIIKFGRGGYQGCRGGNGSDWYLENDLDFLDTTDEHYFDEVTGTLYRAFNSTPTGNEEMSAPLLQTLLETAGTQANPVVGVSISNVGFRDAAPTYMEPHAVPSGGDWALERRAAVFVEGTERLTVSNCTFERLDGNGLMLSGYNREASLIDNEFQWTGGTAIAAWGFTDEITDNGVHGWDGTEGNHPLNTLVKGNVIRETGIWEKQASCWFQAKTARTTLTGNLCFNLARAGFNFNDGFAGGDHVESNLIYNSCRESSDHGPINSWDRQPYVTMFGLHEGRASGLMAPRNITRNFLVANYGGGNGGVDNDDGSEYYRNNHNFQIYGHQKFKVGSIESYGNVLAYVTDYGAKWSPAGNIPTAPNKMYNNTVIFNPLGSQQYHNTDMWMAHDNHLYGPKVTLANANGMTLPEWQAKDPKTNDVGSTWSKQIPAPDFIISVAKTILEPPLV